MLFNSQAFVLGFLPVVLAAYYAMRTEPLRQAVLVGASLAFYAGWDLRFVPALAALTVANWAIARWFGATRRDGVLVAGIVLNLAVLGVCKYANFLGANLAALAGLGWTPLPIILPLGVSFFTFQKISYLVDLRRGDRHVYGLLEFAAFVTFFPQLIAGPLVRHNEMIPQFARDPRGPAIWENLSRGLLLFVIGFAKKAGIADTAALTADPAFAHAAAGMVQGAEAWAGAAAYTLQIYFDFSGYSDMAIGLGLMFGLRLPFNFDAPYRAVSVRDFWRRWHITLSRFLRDYLYIPFGGNRAGAWMQARNVVATMLLGGLWHGAAWNFVAWGGAHGVALAVNGAFARAGGHMPRLLGWGLTLVFVVLAWVLFRAPDSATAVRMYAGMAGLEGWGSVRVEGRWVLAAAAAIALVGPTSQAVALERLRANRWAAGVAGAALAGCCCWRAAGCRTSSSISSSDPWHGFARTVLIVAAAVVGVLYAFVVVVDPWDALPLSPRWPRVPISSNARFSFPALARSPRFDAAVLGTSTARLLRPVDLDPEFGARFVNLAMNSATAWEQTQMLAVFLRAHPRPLAVLIDMDGAWCGPAADRLTPRPFPDWMYRDNRWPGYWQVFTPYAVQEAANQAAVLLHWKRQRYGSDGYTSFVPPDSAYDPARVDAAFARWPPTDETPVAADSAQAFPALLLLGPALRSIPSATRVVLFFPPAHVEQQGRPGSRTAVRWADCKREVVRIAARTGPADRTTVADMLIPSAITQDRGNYWDPLHYRVAVAGRIAALLGGAAGEEMRVLGDRQATAAPSLR